MFEPKVKFPSPRDVSAIARMLQAVFDLLGLAWVDEESNVYITSTGEEFIESKQLDKIFEKQLLKYQFYNPAFREKYFRSIKLFPHIFLLEILAQFKKSGLTKDEYILFVSRAKSPVELDKKIELIDRFRNLAIDEQRSLIKKIEKIKIPSKGDSSRRTSIYNTIFLNYSYAINFLTLPSYIKFQDGWIRLKKSQINFVENLIREHKQKAIFVEFANEKDWFAFYGDNTKDSSYLNALDYYESKTDVPKSIEIFREAQKRNLLKGIDEKDYIVGRIKEKILEDYLESNLEDLERGLTLISRQYATLVGSIDLLAKDENNNYVVIELKKGRSSDRVFGQITRYIGWIKENIAKPNQEVRGIIVGSPIDQKLIYSVKSIQPERFKLKEFQFFFKFTDKI